MWSLPQIAGSANNCHECTVIRTPSQEVSIDFSDFTNYPQAAFDVPERPSCRQRTALRSSICSRFHQFSSVEVLRMFDTHCHLTFPEFADRTASILADAAAVGVRGAITIATTSADSLRCRDLAAEHPTLWHSAGVHPLYSDQPIDWDALREAAQSPKCVAWGELGRDNHYAQPPRELQTRVLAEQLAFIDDARRTDARLDKPLILHCREAFDDLIAVLRTTSFEPSRMVFHCFTGTVEDARKVLDFGAWISFTGVVTFASALSVAEAAAICPADRILIETDSPFLTPEPMRKVRPNEPKYVVHVAEKIAALRGLRGDAAAAFQQQLDANVERFFGIAIRRE